MAMAVKLEKRLNPSTAMNVIVPLLSIFAAFLVGAVFLTLTDREPLEVYSAMFKGALGSEYGLAETVVKAIPLMLCALGISAAFRMQLWNIGAEGQFYMGAFAASWVPLTFPQTPMVLMLPGMFVMGCIGGGLWGLAPAVLRARWKVNEIITTLMLNYVAILWVDFLVYGPWKDPKGFNFPLTAKFPPAAALPTFGDSRIHVGLILAIILAAAFWLIFEKSRWGYEVKVIGASEQAARYAGMNIRRNIYWVMLLSGAVCGLAGMAEVGGIVGRLQPNLSPGYGYTAIIVAWLSKLNPAAILVVSVLFGALQVGGFFVQTMGVPASVASMLQGAVLFFVVGGEFLTQYRLVISRKEVA